MTDPDVYLINFRRTNQPQNIGFLDKIFGFSGSGVQKRDTNIFTKSPCRKLFPRKFSENRQKFGYQFFLHFFCFIEFFGCFLGVGLQKHYTKRFCKKIVSKSFSNQIDKKIQKRFFWIFLITFLGVSRWGVQKHDKKSQKKLTSPGTFLASEEPTNRVGARHFCFECPLISGPKGGRAVGVD
jgi:hypothetical protein